MDHVDDDLVMDDLREPIRGQVMRPLLRNNDEVCVGHAVSMDQIAHALKWKRPRRRLSF